MLYVRGKCKMILVISYFYSRVTQFVVHKK